MSSAFDIWKMLAGIAFFLLAMNFMEEALHLLAGRRFKLFLKKQSGSRIKAVLGATVVTGLLQSSSIVNLLVLSMAGAGVVQMDNALALILGSNLGSTFNSWLVATLGFNFNIEKISSRSDLNYRYLFVPVARMYLADRIISKFMLLWMGLQR